MSDGKPSVTKSDLATDEPEVDRSEPSPVEKTAAAVGLTGEVLEKGLQQGEKMAEGAAKAATSGSEEAAQLSGLAQQAGALGTVMRTVGVVGKVIDAGLSIKEAYDNPTAGNITKAVLKTALAALSTNPIISIGITVADYCGLFKW